MIARNEGDMSAESGAYVVRGDPRWRLVPSGPDRARRLRVTLAAGVCLLTGATAAFRPEAAPLIAIAAVFAMICVEWRRGVWALLVLMPFAGVPVFIGGTPGLAVRDAAVVLPLYVGFAAAFARDGEAIRMPPLGIALPALAVFALIVVLGVPRAPSVSVGVLGTRVWLAYVPLLVIGYHFIRRSEDFDRVLALTARLGLVPAALAVAEWVAAARAGGSFGAFSHLYGSSGVVPAALVGDWLAAARTGGSFGPFSHLYAASGALPRSFVFGSSDHFVLITRIPSTFTSAQSYYGFSIVAFSAALAQVLRHGGRGWTVCTMALAAGAAASGARAAYVMVPMITVATLLLSGFRLSRLAAVAVVVGAMVIALAAGGADPLLVARLLPGHAQVELTYGWHEMQSGGLTAFGHGTGWDTNAALRYGDTDQWRYIENWFAKASLELGAVGLASITVALAALVFHTLRPLRDVDAATRQLAAPVCALLVLTVLSLFKGPYIDLDPLNVYFWLLAGMLAGLYRAAGATAESREETRGESGST